MLSLSIIVPVMLLLFLGNPIILLFFLLHLDGIENLRIVIIVSSINLLLLLLMLLWRVLILILYLLFCLFFTNKINLFLTLLKHPQYIPHQRNRKSFIFDKYLHFFNTNNRLRFAQLINNLISQLLDWFLNFVPFGVG